MSDSSSPNYHDHAPNETVLVDLANPAGASELVIKFGMFDAGNDWWWAIDNVVVNAGVKPPSLVTSPSSVEVDEGSEATFSVAVDGSGPFKYEWFYNGESIGVYDSAESSNTLVISRASADDAGAYSVAVSNAGGATPKTANALLEVKAALAGSQLFFEGFEGLPLGPNVDEALAGEAVWTDTLPNGWSRDNLDTPGLDDDEVGVREWEGEFCDAGMVGCNGR